MATFYVASDVVWWGNPTQSPDGVRGTIARYYWEAYVNGDYVYRDNKRYLRITKISIKLSWQGRNGPGFTEPIPETGGSFLIYPYYGAPGTITLRVRSRVTNFGYDIDTQVFYINGGSGLELEPTLWPINYTRTTGFRVWTGSRDILLPNDGGILNLYATTSNCGEYNDWGNIPSNSYPSWTPNVPGVQYYSSSGWKTNRIKRWNGSSWVNIPGRRWNGSSWEEVKG